MDGKGTQTAQVVDEKTNTTSNQEPHITSSETDQVNHADHETTLVVTIPAYNEAKTIGTVIQNISRDCCTRVKVLVVDDGSKDSTVQTAYNAGADKVISHLNNLGLAITFRDALDTALEMDADIIVNIDADGQYDPKEITKLIEPIQNGTADIVLGSRFNGYIEDMPLRKKIGNRIATRITSRAAGRYISDAQTGFRAFSRDAAMRFNIMSDFTYTQETIIQSVDKHLRIQEVPINFYKREDASRLFPNVWTYAKKAGSAVIRTYLYHKPLKTFMYIGSVVLAVGIILGLRVLIHYIATSHVAPYLPTSVLSAVFSIVGFQVIILGLIADLIRRNQNVQEEILYRLKKNNRRK